MTPALSRTIPLEAATLRCPGCRNDVEAGDKENIRYDIQLEHVSALVSLRNLVVLTGLLWIECNGPIDQLKREIKCKYSTYFVI